MILKLWLTGIASITVLQLYAQDSLRLSMEEMVALSVENSKQLKIAYAKVQEAEAHLGQTKTHRYPEVNLSGAHLRLNSPTVETHFGTGQAGGDDEGSKTDAPDVSQVTYGALNITQPIFSGFKIHYATRSAEYLKKASELDAENQKEEVILNTIAAYYNFYKLKVTERLILQSLDQAKERVQLFSNLEQNGVITRNDLLKAQMQQSDMELALIDIAHDIEVANFELTLLLGLPENSIISLDPGSVEGPIEDIGGITAFVQQAVTDRVDLKALAIKEKAATAAVKVAKGNYYPSLALTGGYVNAIIPNFITVTNAINVGLGLQYSLSGIFGNRQTVQEAKARQDQVALTRELQYDKIKTEIYKEYAHYKFILKKMETLKLAKEQAVENYRITQNMFNNNLVLTTDLLEAEVKELQAQVNELHARADAKISYYQLEKAAGLLDKVLNYQN